MNEPNTAGPSDDAMDDDDRRIIASVIKGADITEIYSPERVNKLAARMGLTPGHSLDLTNGWDFTRASHRKAAIWYVTKVKPWLLIGSPGCRMFSK